MKLQREALLLEIKNKKAMANLIQEATAFFEAANAGVSVIVQPASDPFLQQDEDYSRGPHDYHEGETEEQLPVERGSMSPSSSRPAVVLQNEDGSPYTSVNDD